MILILDSNVFYDDYALKGTLLRILFEYLPKTGFRMIIPEVVYLEVVNQVREKITAAVDANNRRINDLEQKTGLSVSKIIYTTDIDKQAKKYAEFFRKRLDKVGGTIAKIPSISHKKIIERDLARKKPFTKSGKGYRDALIWETLLYIASTEEDPIVFISENSTDFANDEKNGLHSDLHLDLFNRQVDSSRVTLVLSLQSFVKEKLVPNLPSAEQTIASFMQKISPSYSIEELLAERFSEEFVGQDIKHHIVGKPDVYENISISMVEYVGDVEVIGEHKLSSNERMLELECTLDCEFDAFIFKSDLYCMSEDEWPHVWDPDWNKHYVAVSFSDSIKAQTLVTLDIKSGKISSVELIETEGLNIDL